MMLFKNSNGEVEHKYNVETSFYWFGVYRHIGKGEMQIREVHLSFQRKPFIHTEQTKEKTTTINMKWGFQVRYSNKEWLRGKTWGQNLSKFLKAYQEKHTTSRTEKNLSVLLQKQQLPKYQHYYIVMLDHHKKQSKSLCHPFLLKFRAIFIWQDYFIFFFPKTN